MASNEELLEQIADELETQNVKADVIERITTSLRSELDSSGLRKKLGELEAWRKDKGEPAIDKLQRYETAPKRKEALHRVGVDYESQPLYGREVLDSIPIDKLDDLEYVSQFVRDKGFEATAPIEQEQEQPPAAGVVEHATSAPTTQTGSLTLKPEDTEEWTTERLLRLRDKVGPDKWEALKRGEEIIVTGAI